MYLTYYPFTPDMSQVVHPIIRSLIEISLINWSGCQEVITHLRRRKRSINLIWSNKKVKFLPCHLLSVILGSLEVHLMSVEIADIQDCVYVMIILPSKKDEMKKWSHTTIKEHSKVTEQRTDKCFMNCLMYTVSNPGNDNTSAALLSYCRTIRINKLFVD